MKTDKVEKWIDNNMPRRVDGNGEKWHTREEVVEALTQYHQDMMSDEQSREHDEVDNAPFNFVIQEMKMEASDKVKLIKLMNKALQRDQDMMKEVREKAWKEILEHNAKKGKDIYLPVDIMHLLNFDKEHHDPNKRNKTSHYYPRTIR